MLSLPASQGWVTFSSQQRGALRGPSVWAAGVPVHREAVGWHTGALEDEAGGGLAQRLPTLRSHLPSAVSPHQGSNCHQGLFPLSLLSYSSEYDGSETGRKFQENSQLVSQEV